MDTFLSINDFLLYYRSIFLWFTYTDKARHEIFIWKIKYIFCIFSFITQRNSQSTAIALGC